jgi:glycosyltransferase involved in cell wall biosynthesis
MRIAYLVNDYPKISHIFIRREILSLERHGLEVMRVALRGWDNEIVDEEDRSERELTRYALRGGPPALLMALIRMAVTRPIRLIRAMALAWSMARHAERSLLVHFVYLAEACRIQPWLRRADIKHLHAHFGTNSAEIAMLVRALGGPPWSFTVHGPEEFDKREGIHLADKIRGCAFVVAISSFGRSQLYRCVEHRYWPKVEVVHCGLEAAFYAAPATAVPVARRLVCVGRLCEQKGQLLLVEAARRLADRKIDFELTFVGDGEMRAEIEAMVIRHTLQGRVRITGHISSRQLRDEILAARALVLPSFAEGLPMVIMEAMALRRPVISTFIAGIPELLVPGEHGWLVPAGDVEALAVAMQACLEASADTLARMGAAAYDRVLTRHCAELQSARLANLFEAAARATNGVA